jgi:hypothetical protein
VFNPHSDGLAKRRRDAVALMREPNRPCRVGVGDRDPHALTAAKEHGVEMLVQAVSVYPPSIEMSAASASQESWSLVRRLPHNAR